MPKPKKSRVPAATTSANVGYEAELWQMADALRGSMDAAEYKHVVLASSSSSTSPTPSRSCMPSSGIANQVRTSGLEVKLDIPARSPQESAEVFRISPQFAQIAASSAYIKDDGSDSRR